MHPFHPKLSNLRLFPACLALLWLVAPAAFAGTVYVPLIADPALDSVEVTTEIRLTNLGEVDHEVAAVFLPADVDGTLVDRTSPLVVTLEAGTSLVVDSSIFGATVRGVLEITTEPDVFVTARLVGVSNAGARRVGSDVPVASSENLLPAGSRILLQGIDRRGDAVSDLLLFNLAAAPNACAITAHRRNGNVTAEASWTVAPLSLLSVESVLAELGLDDVVEISLGIVCDGDALALAVRREVRTGEIALVLPAGSGASTLTPPSTTPPPPPPPPPPPTNPSACAQDAVFAAEGRFHRPKRGAETWEARVLAPNKTFSQLVLEMDFTHGGWDPAMPEGNHAIFWMHRDERWRGNVYGYVNLFGPPKNFARLGTYIQEDISPQETKVAVFEPGKTYHVRYILDTASQTGRVILSEGGQEIARLRDTGIGNRITTGQDGIRVIVGHPARTAGQAGPEVPTYGWNYSNLCVYVE